MNFQHLDILSDHSEPQPRLYFGRAVLRLLLLRCWLHEPAWESGPSVGRVVFGSNKNSKTVKIHCSDTKANRRKTAPKIIWYINDDTNLLIFRNLDFQCHQLPRYLVLIQINVSSASYVALALKNNAKITFPVFQFCPKCNLKTAKTI